MTYVQFDPRYKVQLTLWSGSSQSFFPSVLLLDILRTAFIGDLIPEVLLYR